MGVAPENQRPDPYAVFHDQANRFFESQLARLHLTEAEVLGQDIAQLEDSLVRIDDALRAPESFGVFRLTMSANAAVVLVKSNTESHVQIGVVPILLERKSLVIDRLRELRSQRPIATLGELVDSIADSGLRQRLRSELEATRGKKVQACERRPVRPGSAFIAMAMDPTIDALEDVLDAIQQAARQVDITAERIDSRLTNEPITPRMLERIESAEFVVVDITHARPNVFYEAGFATGLGKPPVYIAAKNAETPFDIKDYPIIRYTSLVDLKRQLADMLGSLKVRKQ